MAEAITFEFLTKSGAVKAQLGVFGRSESIGDLFTGI
jgi:hypothetical protein